MRAWRANRRVPSAPETSPRADRQLFLRPTGIAEDRRAAQPCATNELACGIEALRRAPPQLTADDSGGAQHTTSAGAWSGRHSDAPERISERTDLFVATSVHELGFGDGLAPADDSSRPRILQHGAGVGSVSGLQLHCREGGDPRSPSELGRRLDVRLVAWKRTRCCHAGRLMA